MYLKRVREKNQKTYYYLMRHCVLENRDVIASRIGSLEDVCPLKESELLTAWSLRLLSGTESADQEHRQKMNQFNDAVRARSLTSFDLEKCKEELKLIRARYGKLTKQLLETKARPNGELSWTVTTIRKHLARKGLKLSDLFSMVPISNDSKS